MNEKVRLQKYISECGITSRRKAEELIESRFVKVNGRVAKLGDKIDPRKDLVTVHGKPIRNESEKIYIVINKPRGYLTSVTDDRDRKCVTDLTKTIKERIYPVGRLDKDSEGMLLMTNDGEFANMMMHPRSKIGKTYRVTVRGKVTDEITTKLTEGVVLDDGIKTLPCEISVMESAEDRTVLSIILYEGRNRQIRRMCEAVDLRVIRLKRTAISTLKLGMLKPGKWRELTEKEITKLRCDALRSDKNETDEQPKKRGRRK